MGMVHAMNKTELRLSLVSGSGDDDKTIVNTIPSVKKYGICQEQYQKEDEEWLIAGAKVGPLKESIEGRNILTFVAADNWTKTGRRGSNDPASLYYRCTAEQDTELTTELDKISLDGNPDAVKNERGKKTKDATFVTGVYGLAPKGAFLKGGEPGKLGNLLDQLASTKSWRVTNINGSYHVHRKG